MKFAPRALVCAAVFLGLAARASAQQSAGQKMGASSTLVFGAVSDGKQGANFVSRGGGFFIDSRHVVANFQDCCGKSDQGEQVFPIVYFGKDDASAAKVIWSSDDTEIAILELSQPLNHPGVTISPARLQKPGQPVFSVQYPKPGDNSAPRLAEGKLSGTASAGNNNSPLFKTSLEMNSNNAGGALFDACGDAIGINLTMKDGAHYAFVIDPLLDGLKAAGVEASVTDQPCSANQVSLGSAGESSSDGKASGSKEGGKEDGKSEGKAASRLPFQMPHGSEWVGVVIVVAILVLAFRPGRKKIPRTATVPLSQAAPYPAPVGYPAAQQPGAYASAPPPGVALKPVLKGIEGQYAGASFPLESGDSTLGRDPRAANLVFSGDAPSVSKRHCSLRWDAARNVFVIEDHGSTNGTFLAGGERLAPHQPRELHAGDRFYIGDLRNQFEVAMEP